jgi:hypothetical protein
MYDSTYDTRKHINRVGLYLAIFQGFLSDRADLHDASKLLPPEKETFDRVTPLLKELTYGSDEYRETLASMYDALEHHYANNRHHPEHFPNGINGMNLIDLVEMVCDWKAASERHADGDIYKSLEINKKRFEMSDQLYQILKNTVNML